jgi:hypothetical protein
LGNGCGCVVIFFFWVVASGVLVCFADFRNESVKGDIVVFGDWIVVVNRWDSNKGEKGDGCVVEEVVGGKVEYTKEELGVWYLGVEVRLGSCVV